MTDDQLKGLAHQAANMYRVDWEQGKRPQMVISVYSDGELNRMQRLEQTITDSAGQGWASDKAVKVKVSRSLRMAVHNLQPEAMVLAVAGERTASDNVLPEDVAIVGTAQTKDRVCFCVCSVKGDSPPSYEFYDASDFSGLFQLFREPEEETLAH